MTVDSTDHVIGPRDARVTVIEYADFECPSCRQAEPAVKMMLSRFGRDVRLVFRHFPQETAHPHALAAAEAAECAAAQGQFWPMHDLLLEHQSHLDRKHLENYASQVGLDMSRFIAELDDQPPLGQCQGSHEVSVGVQGSAGFGGLGQYRLRLGQVAPNDEQLGPHGRGCGPAPGDVGPSGEGDHAQCNRAPP